MNCLKTNIKRTYTEQQEATLEALTDTAKRELVETNSSRLKRRLRSSKSRPLSSLLILIVIKTALRMKKIQIVSLSVLALAVVLGMYSWLS